MRKLTLLLICLLLVCAVLSCAQISGKDISYTEYSEHQSAPPEASVEISDEISETSFFTEASTEQSVENFRIEAEVYAKQAFVYNLTDDFFIYEKGTDQVISPASITKLLTALYATENMPLDTKITVGDELYLMSPFSSVAGIKIGQTYTFEQLLAGMLLPSGNDCAYTIAVSVGRYVSGDQNMPSHAALDFFMQEMNKYAKEIGCTNTNYLVPDGLAEREHFTTAQDLVVIAYNALTNYHVSRIISTPEYAFILPTGEEITYRNTNMFLHKGSEYYIPNVTGLKTGTLFGYSILVSANVGSDTYLIGVFESDSHLNRYNDAKALLDEIIGGN